MPNYYQPPQMYQNSNGIISVPNEEVVESYPVAPGNCVTFKVEGKPIVMEKSMGFSQFEPPKIEKYRLVRESVSQPQQDSFESRQGNSAIDDLKMEIRDLWAEIDTLKKKRGKDDAEYKRSYERGNSTKE